MTPFANVAVPPRGLVLTPVSVRVCGLRSQAGVVVGQQLLPP